MFTPGQYTPGNLFSFTGGQQAPTPQGSGLQTLQGLIASNPLLSQPTQQPAAPQNSSLDPLKLGAALGQKQGPMGLPPIDPVGGITNGMGTAGKVLNPLGMIFGSGGLFG